MAILQSFLGNKAKCMKYLDFAMSIIVELSQGDVPAGLKETVLYMRVCNTFWVNPERSRKQWCKLRQECGELGQEYSTFPASIKKRNIFQRSELCRWLMELEVRLGHSFHKDFFGRGFYEEADWYSTPNRSTDLPEEGSGVRVAEGMEQGGRSGTDVVLEINPHGEEGETEEVVPAPGKMSHKFAAHAMQEFDVLKHAVVTNADIRGGVGELCFRSVMGYVSHLEGRDDDSLENLTRCGEIIAEHPGLCRYNTWRHTMHCILNALATRGVEDKYEEMRKVYNSMNIQPGTPQAPPLEEWSGIKNICKSYFCRSAASVETSKTHGGSNKGKFPANPSNKDGDVSSPEAARKGNAQHGMEGKHWAMTPDGHDCPTLVGKSNPDESRGFVKGCVAAPGNGQGIPREKGVGGKYHMMGYNPTRLGGSSGSGESVSQNQEGGLWGRNASDGFGSASARGMGRSGELTTVYGGCDVSGLRAEQLMPQPLTSRRGDGLEGSGNSSMIDALGALLTDADFETFCENELP